MNKIAFIFILCLLSFGTKAQVESESFAVMINTLLDKSVPLKACAVLSDEIKTNRVGLILDAREKREFDISHIPGAIWVGYDDFNSRRLDGISRNADVTVYCSVGYRSEKVAEQMKNLGFTQLHNLHGGIFEWMNQGYEVVNSEDEKTEQIHAYDKVWGVWLSKGEKIYE